MKKIAPFVFSLLFIVSCTAQNGGPINPEAFDKGIQAKESVQLLDVRTPAEFASGHIKGALLADWNNKAEFARRTGFIDKNKPLYVYCLGGGRSAAAAKVLREQGYKNVYELQGGINAWKAAGLSLEGKSEAPQLSVADFNASIQSDKPVLVDFGAEWCPPCRTMEPILNSLQKNKAGSFKLVKVDGGKDEDVLKIYNVTALPVFIIFKNGKEVWRKEGVATEEEIAAQL